MHAEDGINVSAVYRNYLNVFISRLNNRLMFYFIEMVGQKNTMIMLRPQQGKLRLVSRLLSLMRGKPRMRLNNLETNERFLCLGLCRTTDSVNDQ